MPEFALRRHGLRLRGDELELADLCAEHCLAGIDDVVRLDERKLAEVADRLRHETTPRAA